jgi:hypothetical protein
MRINGEEVLSSNDITHWLHECNRYLFLAKVNLDRIKRNSDEPEVIPVSDDDPRKYIETIVNLSKVQSGGNEVLSPRLLIQDPRDGPALVSLSRDIHIKITVSSEDISTLKQVLNLIHEKDWNNLDVKRVENAQVILYGLLTSVKESFVEIG